VSPALQTIAGLSRLLREGELSPLELVEETLARIERLNPKLNAYITVTGDAAREQARQAEKEIRDGLWRGPLHGVPYAAKDLFHTRGVRTTMGSKIHTDFVPEADAAVVEKLHAAGAILIGKTGLHENAYGITSNNPHFGAVRNPWDPERIPGGSSGGSTSALAAGLCSFSLGTDTGGSIRIPASFCGLSGLKATFGRVSRRGCHPLGHTLDHVGPFAWTVEETGWIYEAIAGPDPADDSSIDDPLTMPEAIPERLDGRKIGVPRDFYFEGLDGEVDQAVRRALETLQALGAELVEVRLPDIEEMNAIGRLILLAEATSVHHRNLDERPEDFGLDQIALFDQGRFVTAVDYLDAQRRRRQLSHGFYTALEGVDVIATPTIPILPAKIGQTTTKVNGVTLDVRLATTRNVRALNLTGLPLLSVPCGLSEGGLPIGMQLIGALLDEKSLLEIGGSYQRATDWHTKRPPIAGE